MNGEGTSKRYGGRGIHGAAESSAKEKHTLSGCSQCHDQGCSRPKLLEKSSHGRRRTESAPNVLLDCLHCGKDLPDLREERTVCRPSKRHTRRHTVSTEREWSPLNSTSSLRPSFTQHQRNGANHHCQVCSSCCPEGSRRKGDGRHGNSRRQSFNNRCQSCGDYCQDYVQKNMGQASHRNLCDRKDIFRQAERSRINPTSTYPRSFTYDDSSGDDFVGNTTTPSHHDSSRPVGFGRGSLKCKGDTTEDATGDDDDESEIGLVNMNENKRRKSMTALTRHCYKDNDRAAVRHKSKSCGGYPGMHKEKLSCPGHHDRHAELQKGDTTTSRKGQRRSAPYRAERTRYQPLASDDEEDNPSEADTVESKDHTVGHRDSLLVANLSDMLKHHRLCDVILRTNGQEVPAHRLALAAFSDTFARNYCEGDSREMVIDVPDTSVGGIQEVLRFVYSGELRLNPDNVGNVLAAAAFLHIDHILSMCKQIILNPDLDTVILFSSLAERYQLTEDLSYFFDFMCKHFLGVSRTRGWRTLAFSHVFDLLSENNLNVERELDVFHAAVAWIEADRSSRLAFTADLIGCVRFAYITPDEIAKHVETKQFLFQGDEGKELLLCIYRHHALHTCGCQQAGRGHHLPRRQYVPLEAMPPQDQSNSAYTSRQRLVLPSAARAAHSRTLTHAPLTCDLILAVGGVNPFQPEVEAQSRQVAQFHPRQNRWSTLTRLPDGRHHHGAVLLGGFLYIIGGSILDDTNPECLCNPTASCFRWDLTAKQWTAIAPLGVPRMYHATAVLNDVIFVMAGQTQQSRHLSSMECYRPEVGEWEAGVEMGEGRIGVAVAAFQGQLFAVGGFLETEHEHVVRATVEVFDPRTYSWTGLKPLPSPRCHASLVECGGKLYLVGGSTFPADSPSVCSLPSVLRYDDKDDRWDRIQTLRSPRHDMGVAVLGCRIFIMGGVSSVENKVLSDVECYDVETDYWLDDVEPIGTPALGLACLTLPADQ